MDSDSAKPAQGGRRAPPASEASGGRISPEILIQAGATVLAMLAVLIAPRIFSDGDTYWHLKAGEWIVSHTQMLRHDVFSYTHLGRPWVPQEWLSEVLMGLAFEAGGWAGLVVLFGLAAALAGFILAGQLRRSMTGISLVLCLVLAFGCMRIGLLARPHLLALPVMALWIAELVNARDQRRGPSWLLVPLMAFWANLHGSFLFGFIPFAALTVEVALERGPGWIGRLRPWVLVGGCAALASLATPVGYHAYLNGLSSVAIGDLGVIDEWKALDFATAIPVEVAILWTIFICIHRGARVPPVRLALLLLLLHLAITHQRHVMLLAVAAPILLAGPIGAALDQHPRGGRVGPRLGLGILAALAAMAAATLALGRSRADDTVSPGAALDHVPAAVAAAPVFNNYDFGGFLIFRGVRPFIDGRADLYGARHVTDYVAAQRDPAALHALLQRHGVQWTLLRPTDAAAAMMNDEPGWRRVYQGPYAVVHIRDQPAPGR